MRQNYGFVVAVPHPALQFSIARKTKQKEKKILNFELWIFGSPLDAAG
jgi:hypothetical protein